MKMVRTIVLSITFIVLVKLYDINQISIFMYNYILLCYNIVGRTARN